MWTLESTLQDTIQDIIRKKQLIALFQPIINIHSGEVFGYEGLIRGPAGGLHAPTELLSLASSEGLRTPLELTCLELLMDRFVSDQLPGYLFLNMSPEVLVQLCYESHPGFEMWHAQAKLQGRVVLELTEGERAIEYTPEVMRLAVKKCHEMGYYMAIDDLGEGFSSLRLWSELRPRFVKVDRYFIHNIQNDPVKTQFVRSILDIARHAQCQVIAEGVETTEEWYVLNRLGISLGQGHLFCYPVDIPPKSISWPPSSEKPVRDSQGQSAQNLKDSLFSKKLVRFQDPVDSQWTNERVLLLFENHPILDSIPVVDGDRKPLGLLTRQTMTEVFSQPYRHELFGRKSCTQFMDTEPYIVPLSTTVQDISHALSFAHKRHFIQGFLVVDDGRYYGMGHGQDVMAVMTDMQIQAAKYANPLTQLPGNVPIHEQLEQLLSLQTPFVVCHGDLDFFKPYNDCYGFSAGDRVIQLTAQILSEVCDHHIDYLGHIGGDDFIVLFQSPDWERRCREAMEMFDQQILLHYSPQDLEAGGLYAENRQRVREFFPVISLSLGVVMVPAGSPYSYMDISQVASEAKTQAKRVLGSSLFVNRRGPS